MGILLKLIFKNILDKKFRTSLIIFTITISSALFFASTTIPKTMEKMYIAQARTHVGNSDFILTSKDHNPFYEPVQMSDTEGIDYVINTIEGMGLFRPENNDIVHLRVRGTSFLDLQKISDINLKSPDNQPDFQGNKIIISEDLATKYNLNIGDTIEIEGFGVDADFIISGISYPSGPFAQEGTTAFVAIPLDYLQTIYNLDNLVNKTYVKLIDGYDMETVLGLSGISSTHEIAESVDWREVDRYINIVTTPFKVVLVLVMLLAIFIIYTSFKLITMERLPLLGTLRSLGATKIRSALVLVFEALGYGFVGGILGAILGIGFLTLMSVITRTPWSQGSTGYTTFRFGNLVYTFLIALVIPLLSVMGPAKRLSSFSVKDIVLGLGDSNSKNHGFIPLGIGLVFLNMALLMPLFARKDILLITTVLSMLLGLMSILLLVPYVNTLFVGVTEKIMAGTFGNISYLALKNLKDNKNMLSNISLLSMGIAILLTVNTVTGSVLRQVTDHFSSTANFGITLMGDKMDLDFHDMVLSVDGVSDITGILRRESIEVYQKGSIRGNTLGVDPHKFLNFWDIDLSQESILKLNKSKNFITTSVITEELGIKVGDRILLTTPNGSVEYTLVDVFDTIMDHGEFILISQENFQEDVALGNFAEIYVKTTEPDDAVKEKLKEILYTFEPIIETTQEQRITNYKLNMQIFTILRGFTILTLLIALFGIISNYTLNYLERKKVLAMLRSLGLNKGQMLSMFLMEALFSGFLGSTLGILGGILLVKNMPYILKAIIAPMAVDFSISVMATSLVLGVFTSTIASIAPIFKGNKLSIIKEIRHE